MKPILYHLKIESFVVLLALIVTGVKSQTFNHAQHFGQDKTFGMVQINDKSYYLELTTRVPSCCNDELNLVGLDADGNEIMRKRVMSYSYLEGCRLAKTPSKKILVIGHSKSAGCDVTYTESTICEVDTLGAVSWSFTLNFEIRDVCAINNGSYYLASADNIYRFSGAVLTHSFSSGVSGIISLASTQSSNVVVSYTTGINSYIRLFSGTGSLIKEVNSGTPLNDLQYTGSGYLYARATGELQKRDDSLALLYNTLGNLPSGQQVNAFTCRNDSVFAAGQDANKAPVFFRFDDHLNLISNTVSNVENAIASGIGVNNFNRVNIVTWGSIKTNPGHTYTGVLNTGLQGNLLAKQDVGVKSIHVISSTYEMGGAGPLGILDADVTVQNFGPDTIRSFHLNHFLLATGTSYCLGGMMKPFSVTIAPGDSATVNTGTIYAYPINAGTSTVVPMPPVNYLLCIYTTVPDSSYDINIQNDENCTSTSLIFVGLNELETESQIMVAPNPSSGEFLLTAPVNIKHVTICDNLGRTVDDFNLDSKEFHFREVLPPGMYFLKIQSENYYYTKKIVID